MTLKSSKSVLRQGRRVLSLVFDNGMTADMDEEEASKWLVRIGGVMLGDEFDRVIGGVNVGDRYYGGVTRDKATVSAVRKWLSAGAI